MQMYCRETFDKSDIIPVGEVNMYTLLWRWRLFEREATIRVNTVNFDRQIVFQ